MEIYKYILVILGGYIAICAAFNKIGIRLPICLQNIFGNQISFLMQFIVVFGFLYWLFSEINKRFFLKEGWISINDIRDSAKTNDDIDATLIPTDVEDIPDVPCPTNPNSDSSGLSESEQKIFDELTTQEKSGNLSGEDKTTLANLKKKTESSRLGSSTGTKSINPATGLCHGQFADIPTGNYGFTIVTKDVNKNNATVREQKMRPLKSVSKDCKLRTGPQGRPTIERAVVVKSPDSDSKKCINQVNIIKSQSGSLQYDPNNLDTIRTNKELSGSEKEEKQKNFAVDIDLVQPKPVYYEPGSYTFGASTYVPNYEQSVYLSKTTNLSQMSPITLPSDKSGGFCSSLKNDKIGLDKKCQSLSPDVCASTGCCVLLGGEKCFGGSDTGPTNKAAFSDTTITNRDYYYYTSKCYGNCP